MPIPRPTHTHTSTRTDATQSVYCPISIDIHNLFCTFVGWRVRAGGAPPMKRVTCVLFNGLWPRKDKQLFRLIVYGIINWDRKAPTTTKLSWAITGKKRRKRKFRVRKLFWVHFSRWKSHEKCVYDTLNYWQCLNLIFFRIMFWK